jgi:hypothetical protein
MVYLKDEGSTIALLAKSGDSMNIVKRDPEYGGPAEILPRAGQWYPVGTVTTNRRGARGDQMRRLALLLAAVLFTSFAAAVAGEPRLRPSVDDHECFLHATSCGANLTDEINIFGCRYVTANSTLYYNRYRLVAQQGTFLTVTVTATSFIPELGISSVNDDIYQDYNTNSSRANTISLSRVRMKSSTYDIDVFAKSPFTGTFRMTVSCEACTIPTINSHPVSMNVAFGGTATLIVSASGKEPMQYVWFDSTQPASIIAVGQQFITPAITSPRQFFAEARNECGTARSGVAAVVPGPCDVLRITRQPSSVKVQYGGMAEFRVEVAGQPPITYEWFIRRSGEPESRIGANAPAVQLQGLQKGGEVYVRVSNACGSINSSAAVVDVPAGPSRRRSTRR